MQQPALNPAAGAERTQLSMRGVSKHFGGVRAVADVSVEVRRGEILSVIGPNARARPRC